MTLISLRQTGHHVSIYWLLATYTVESTAEVVNYLIILFVAYKLNIYYQQYTEKAERDAGAQQVFDREYLEARLQNLLDSES